MGGEQGCRQGLPGNRQTKGPTRTPTPPPSPPLPSTQGFGLTVSKQGTRARASKPLEAAA